MSKPPHRRSTDPGPWWHALLGRSLLEREGLWLIVLSAADLLITYTLLWHQGAGLYESNPLATWIFHRWNIAGMTVFKFGVIGGVIVIAEVVERRRPGLGRAVLILGSVAAAAVVIHGLRLLGRHIYGVEV
jgi:hypothetical protein